MKEWETNEAIKIIEMIIVDNTTEDQLSEADCYNLAKIIAARLEADE